MYTANYYLFWLGNFLGTRETAFYTFQYISPLRDPNDRYNINFDYLFHWHWETFLILIQKHRNIQSEIREKNNACSCRIFTFQKISKLNINVYLQRKREKIKEIVNSFIYSYGWWCFCFVLISVRTHTSCLS